MRRDRGLAVLVALLVLGAFTLVPTFALAAAGDVAPATPVASPSPTDEPSDGPADEPSEEPVEEPGDEPGGEPVDGPTRAPTRAPTEEDDDPPAEVPDDAFEVDDALLRWGINNGSNNRAAAPGTFNLFSAGKIGNPGTGGQLLTDASSGAKWSNGKVAGWKASAGDVRIEKLRPGGGYSAATWAGTKTDRDGVTLGGYAVNTKFSDHQVVFSGGTGSVDPTSRSATIRWTGDFTIVYYSGYSFFYVSDPVLKVTGGIGRLTGTLSGYASSMDDITEWSRIPARTGVVLADLGKVNLGKQLGFTARPKYLGVRVKGVDQHTKGPLAGSFPQTFINFTKAVGIAGYWHSTGAGIDRNKPPLDLAVSYEAGDPIVPEPPKPPKKPNPPDIDNTAPSPPVVQPAGPVPPVQPVPPVRPVRKAPASPARTGADVPVDIKPAVTILPVAGIIPGDGSSRSPLWAAGGIVLLLAALTAASPTIYGVVRRSRAGKTVT